MRRLRFLFARRAVHFAVPVALAAVMFAIAYSPKALAAVQGGATACSQTVRTVVTKLRKNTPTKATLVRWAAWKVKHPDWHPSSSAKPRPRFVKTSTVAFHNVKLACGVNSAGKLVGAIVPVDVASLGDESLNLEQIDDLMPSPVFVASVNPTYPTGYAGSGDPPIFPGGGGGLGGPGGGAAAVPPPVPELPSVVLALTGIFGAMATLRRRRARRQQRCAA